MTAAASSHSVVRVAALAAAPRVRHGFFTRNSTAGETRGDANCAYRTPDETARR